MRTLVLALAAVSLAAGQVRVVVSSAAGDRLASKATLKFGAPPPAAGPAEIAIDSGTRYQTIDGFGATFNEAGLMVLNKLPKDAQEKLLRSVFDPKQGAGFTLMKTPLAACDFAAAGGWYTYDDTPGDVGLNHFSIARDLGPNGQVTFVKRARLYGSFQIQATTDYPPDWMLDAKQVVKPEFYPVLARYFAKYVQEYEKAGVHVDYLSPFNEPQYIYCKIPYSQIRELIRNHIGPEFRRLGLRTKLQVSDSHNREIGLKEFPSILDDPEARRYISTMPVHGYSWEEQTSAPMSKLHDKYPDIPVWMTEVCYAKTIDKRPMPVYGFEDGDRWGRMLIADLKNWTAGWIYWNLFLDEKGGPWLVSVEHEDPDDNPQHPVVIVDTQKKEPVYTGLYYYLAHFSKFVRPGFVRIAAKGDVPGAEFVAFAAPGGGKVLEVVNSAAEPRDFTIRDGSRAARASLPARSIGTFLWK